MDPVVFRRDPWLRGSGYHLATWSLVGLLLELRRVSPDLGAVAGSSGAVLLVAAAVLTSLTHERRIGKMCGIAPEPLDAGAARRWCVIFATLAVASALLLGGEHGDGLVPLWLAGIGAGLVWWGHRARFAWYEGLGAATMAAALLDRSVAWSSGEAPTALRIAVLGVALPAAGWVTSRRYLWFRRPRRDGDPSA